MIRLWLLVSEPAVQLEVSLPIRKSLCLGPDLGLVHPRADGSAGGGRGCGAEVDRRDLPSLASSLGRPRHGGRHANRGPGGTADGDGWPRRHGAEALGPTGECRPRGPATASARDRDGPGQLVWVRATAV